MGYKENCRPLLEYDLLCDALKDIDQVRAEIQRLAPPSWAPETYTSEKQKQSQHFGQIDKNLQFIKETLEIVKRNSGTY